MGASPPVGHRLLAAESGQPRSRAADGPALLAARLVAPGRIEADEVPVPSLGVANVLVDMRAAAICGSDLHIVFGGFEPARLPGAPGYPGHEGVGVVVESADAGFEPGDVVLTVPVARGALCFAEYQVVESRSLLKLPPDANPDKLLMAQQLGTVIYGMKRFWPRGSGQCATIIGAGPVGLFFLQLIKQAGFGSVVVGEPNAARRAIAIALGADVTVDNQRDSVIDATRDVTNGHGAEFVVEAAGHDHTRTDAVRAAGVGARVGLFGYPEVRGEAPFPFAAAFSKGLSLYMTRNAQLEPDLVSFRQAIRMIRDGEVNVGHLLSEPVRLADVGQAFEMAVQQSVVKARLDLTSLPATSS
jgi:L-iditol 2-dehydrogenase